MFWPLFCSAILQHICLAQTEHLSYSLLFFRVCFWFIQPFVWLFNYVSRNGDSCLQLLPVDNVQNHRPKTEIAYSNTLSIYCRIEEHTVGSPCVATVNQTTNSQSQARAGLGIYSIPQSCVMCQQLWRYWQGCYSCCLLRKVERCLQNPLKRQIKSIDNNNCLLCTICMHRNIN